MRIFLLTLILAVSNNLYCQDYPDYFKNGKREWTKKEWRSANTAWFSLYMGRQVRQSIRFMNLSRMYGPKFSQIYIEPISNKGGYENSLIKTLCSQKAKNPLRPSPNLWGAAITHSIFSGITGGTGHSGYDGRFAVFQPFSYGNATGENCDYGSRKGLNITLDLLIDKGIPALGHRRNILNPEFARVGAARFIHINYRLNTVFDYSSSKWVDFILYQQAEVTQVGLNLEISQLSNKPMLNIGIASYMNHFKTTNMLLDVNYQHGTVRGSADAVSAYLGYGSSTGLRKSFLIGAKVSSYFPDAEFNLYIQPTVSYFIIFNLFHKGFLYSIGDNENSGLYRFSYGYNFNVVGIRSADVYKHNFTISRFICLRTNSKQKRK